MQDTHQNYHIKIIIEHISRRVETNNTDKHTVYISIFIYLEVSIIKEIHTYIYIYNDEIDVRIVNNYMHCAC